MKIYIFSLFAIITLCSISADTWHDHWATASENEELKNYKEAEIKYKLAFDLSSINGEIPQYHICIDLARMLIIQERNEEALLILNEAIDSEKLLLRDKAFAFLLSSHIKLKLGNTEGYIQDFTFFNEINPDKIEIDINESKVIIRNFPNYEFARKMYKLYFTSSGYCQNETDLHFLGKDKSICIIYKTNCDCGCGCGEKSKNSKSKTLLNHNKNSNNNIDLIARFDLYDDIKSEMGGLSFDKRTSSIEFCQDNCDSSASTAMIWGALKIPDKRGVAAFAILVEGMRRLCKNCCARGSFYDSCISPLLDGEGMLAQIGRGVDPAND